jgi:hypothetical protein
MNSAAHVPLEPRTRRQRVLLLLALILVPQFVLFGPSLVGARILLPLDILEQQGVYMPFDPAAAPKRPIDPALADLVCELEPERRYAVEAVRAGRIPLWNPLIYCGTPFLASSQPSVFYPLRVIDYLFPGPVAIAWGQLAKALLAGIGAYLFSRRVLRVSFWPAAIGAAIWPNVGFLVLWAGFMMSQVGAQLPWMLLTVDESIRKPKSLWPLGLALATAVLLVSGHSATAAHVLLAAGLYALFRIFDVHGLAAACGRRGLAALGVLALGWGAGILLSGPQTLPTLEYMRESWRIQQREAGHLETRPIGIAGLPAVVMPYIDGSTQSHTGLTVHENRHESTPAAYAGMLALLVLAPLGFGLQRLRRLQFFWLALWFLGLSAILGVPLLERLFELPLLNTLRNNRFTLVSAWATVMMAVAGLELLVRGEFVWRRWFALPLLLLAGVLGLCLWRAHSPPEMLQQIGAVLRAGTGRGAPPCDTLANYEGVLRWFLRVALGYAALAAGCLFAWFKLRGPWARTSRAALVLGLGALAEVTAAGYDVNVQSRPELYYPRVPLLQKLSALPPGRLCGWRCLPASLPQCAGLRDVRGYDAADPARMVELLRLIRNDNAPPPTNYAALQWWFPRVPHGLDDLVGLRYLLLVGPPSPTALFSDGGFRIQELPTALPRPFFARRGELANDKVQRLELLARPSFDPREVVYLEAQDPLPVDPLPADGTARIALDLPERIVIELDVRASGWLVLSDRWTDGWKARVDGAPQPVLCADHAFRAVHVRPGMKTLEFRYEPPSWRQGWLAAGIGAFVALGWFLVAARRP